MAHQELLGTPVMFSLSWWELAWLRSHKEVGVFLFSLVCFSRDSTPSVDSLFSFLFSLFYFFHRVFGLSLCWKCFCIYFKLREGIPYSARFYSILNWILPSKSLWTLISVDLGSILLMVWPFHKVSGSRGELYPYKSLYSTQGVHFFVQMFSMLLFVCVCVWVSTVS